MFSTCPVHQAARKHASPCTGHVVGVSPYITEMFRTKVVRVTARVKVQGDLDMAKRHHMRTFICFGVFCVAVPEYRHQTGSTCRREQQLGEG
jgi:hypothetical protein